MLKTFIIEFYLLLIILINFILDFFIKEKNKGTILGILNSLFLLLGIFLFPLFKNFIGTSTFEFYFDNFSYTLKLLFFVGALIGILGSIHFVEKELLKRKTEYYILILASVLGMSFLVSSKNLLLFFVSFELMSIPLYILSGIRKYDKTSPEAALKFFLIGAFSAGIMFFGISLIYGSTGTIDFQNINGNFKEITPLFTAGLVLLFVGLAFKIAAFPFHSWLPDTYEGAPVSYVAFISVAPKAAAFGAIIRVLFEMIPYEMKDMFFLLVILSFFSMFIGNLLALPQKDLRRLLAYSSIAHIGYILVGVASATEEGIFMTIFYLFAYLFSNMGAFLFVESIRHSKGKTGIEDIRGLAQTNPILSLSMLIILLSLGGIPFVAGFWAKLYVFLAGVKAGLWHLVLWGAILTIVALFYYLMVAKRMYIMEPEKEQKIEIPWNLKLSLGLSVFGVVIFGILPFLLVSLSEWAVIPLFP
jgi:NADH-quinone oxidoreductase subunit N